MEAVQTSDEFIGLSGNDHDFTYIIIVIHSGQRKTPTRGIHFMRTDPEEALNDARQWLSKNDFVPAEPSGIGRQDLWRKTDTEKGFSYVAEIITENHLLF